MTAQQVRELGRANELPGFASDPCVDVQAVLPTPIELDQCGVHPDDIDPDAVIPQGKWRISYRFAPDARLRVVDVCGESCAQWELGDLLAYGVHELSLLLPGDWVWTLPSTGDQAFDDIETCLAYLQSMRNTQRTGEGYDGFEAARRLAVAAVSQIGIKRIGDLERAA